MSILDEREIYTRRILKQYGNSIYRLAYMYVKNTADAEEILQDTILQLLRYEPKFESEAQEKSWLLKTCVNLSLNRIRHNKRFDYEELDERIAGSEDKDLSFVWDAVKQLPEKQRIIVHLFYEEGFSTKEIAQIVHRLEGSVRSDLTRARKQLKVILKEAYDYE